MFKNVLKPVLKLFEDPVEKLRELSYELIAELLEMVPGPMVAAEALPYLIPVLALRLGQLDIVEDSEEVRAMGVSLLSTVIKVA